MTFRSALSTTVMAAATALFIMSCGSTSPMGSKVKEPLSGSKYESNNRFWRSTGKGSSMDDNIAKSKADLQSKKELAQQVQTTMKVVTDQFFADTETANSNEVNDKFLELARQVTNTDIADLRKIGEEKFYNDETDKYTVFIAYEINKKKMLKFMKKKAKLDAKIDKKVQKTIEDIIDKEIDRLESEMED